MVYTFRCSNFQTSPSLLLIGWKKKSRAVSCGKIHVTNFKTLSSTKALQSSAKLCKALHQALPKPCKSSARSSVRSSVKALPKALQHLCPPSVLATQWMEYAVRRGVQGVSPLKLCSKLCSKLYLKPYTEL